VSVRALVVVMAVLFAGAPHGRAQSVRPAAGAGGLSPLQNQALSLQTNGSDGLSLTNKLTGKSFDITAAPFEFILEIGGRTFPAALSDFGPASVGKPSTDTLLVRYKGKGGLAGLAVEAEYRLSPRSWYVRKLLRVINGRTGPIVVRDATVDAFRIENVPLPEKTDNPVFLDGQLFWGLEWPIAEAAVRNGRLALGHFPAAEVPPGGTWTSKTSGLGVSAAGRIEEAFGRYIQEIRANRVDFATFYFDWLCHDNSGPRESEVLANFAALRRLKELYGLQFDIYNSDAGLVESQGTYYPQFKANFLSRFPAGPAKFDPVDGVYVVALVDGRPAVPRHRAPSYPYHNYEWNSGGPKLAGMTFRLPIDRAWKGKTVEFRVMMFGDGADGARAELRLVTPKPVFIPVPLRVGPPETAKEGG